MRRVVATGIGLVTPLGCSVETAWGNILAGKSGIGKITRFDASEISCQVAAEIKSGKEPGQFDADAWVSPKEQRKMGLFMIYGMAAATQAVDDSGWKPEREEDQKRTGVIIGSGIGGLPEIEDGSFTMKDRGYKKLSPFFLPSTLINLTSGFVSMKYGFRGPNHAVVTACSTGAHAIGDAARMIAFGDADVMIAGSAEATICPIGIGGFAASRALSTSFNETPQKSSRPWDRDRDGFVMGEGAGIVVLEEYEHAKARGAKIYGEVVGYGMSGDAYHITAPHPEGRGAFDAMSAAFKNAKINPEQVDYINAHGTSTPLGDMIELGAVKRLFGSAISNVSMSSTKSSIGHLLGGAGSVEAVLSILAMRDNIAPPTLNLDNPSEGTEGVDLVPHKAKERKIDVALSNSFGFGGTNVSLIFKKV